MKIPEKPDTVFPRHWLGYIGLKFVILTGAVLPAFYLASRI